VPHALNKWVSVSVVDSGGTLLLPDVRYDDTNQQTISFGSATSGATCIS